MNLLRSVAVILLIMAAGKSFAQTEYRTCDTDVMWEKAIKRNPHVKAEYQRNLDFFRQYAGEEQLSSSTVIYKIPVVFHVIHNYGTENISKAQILDAMDILNKSFQKLNDDTNMVIPLFQPIFANCQIEFRLATLDPNGDCTDGINRIQSTETFAADDNVKFLINWPSDMYLNIWVVASIGSGAAGYSYYPGIGSPEDGIVMRSDYVGGIGTSNGTNYTERSLAHEVGHWLNLPHTWGSTNTPGDPANCGTDDGVFDTPNCAGTANFSCNTSQSTCGFIDNVQNYMDYAGCHYMFTNGQKARMHAALNSPVGGRNNLYTTNNLGLTGTNDGAVAGVCTPRADFASTKIIVCAGTAVHFRDVSWGGEITTRNWTFTGGSPASDTSMNPVIIYNTPGIYDVTLQVSNSAGGDVITRNALVEVYPSQGTIAVPFSESFETATIPGDWISNNPDNNSTWEISAAASSNGSKCARLGNSASFSGSVDELISPVYDFSTATGINMTFDIAFARKNAGDASNLKISASNNCGNNWIIRYNKTGAQLETGPLMTGAFTPTALQWKTETVNFVSSNISGKDAVRIKFEYTNDAGNNIYIDNINLSGNLTGIKEETMNGFITFPNPASKELTASFTLLENRNVTFTILDIEGRVVYTKHEPLKAGDQEIRMPLSFMPGMYLLNISTGNNIYNRKFIIE